VKKKILNVVTRVEEQKIKAETCDFAYKSQFETNKEISNTLLAYKSYISHRFEIIEVIYTDGLYHHEKAAFSQYSLSL
jgi:hypothetical protein